MRLGMLGIVPDCFALWRWLPWFYESGPANLCQRLSPEQKPEGAARSGAIRQRPPVLGAHDRPAVAKGAPTGRTGVCFPDFINLAISLPEIRLHGMVAP